MEYTSFQLVHHPILPQFHVDILHILLFPFGELLLQEVVWDPGHLWIIYLKLILPPSWQGAR